MKRIFVVIAATFLIGASSPAPQPNSGSAQGAPHENANASKSQQQSPEGFWQKTLTDPVAAYTGVLAIFTAALVAVSAVQIGFLVKSDNRAADAADIANKQMLLTGRQADILERQQGLVREEFFTVHRPRLELKEVFFSAADNFGEISFRIANGGDTLARVIRGFVVAEFVADPRAFNDWTKGDRELLNQNGFKAGQVRPFAIRIEDGTQQALQRLRQKIKEPAKLKAARRYEGVMPPAGKFYIFGGVEYADLRGDEFGTSYTSVFRRVWDPEIESFRRTDGEDDEYST